MDGICLTHATPRTLNQLSRVEAKMAHSHDRLKGLRLESAAMEERSFKLEATLKAAVKAQADTRGPKYRYERRFCILFY